LLKNRVVIKMVNVVVMYSGERYGDGAGNTVEENSSVFSLI